MGKWLGLGVRQGEGHGIVGGAEAGRERSSGVDEGCEVDGKRDSTDRTQRAGAEGRRFKPPTHFFKNFGNFLISRSQVILPR
jgi:hypothetical protein